MKRRILSMITALALCLSLLPPVSLAAEADDTGLCPHHTEHTEDCGYIAPTEGQPCGYECKLCPVEERIAALPEHVTEDNRDTVTAQLQEILSLYAALGEAEQEQIDLTPCVRLQEELDGAYAPELLAAGSNEKAGGTETEPISVTADCDIWDGGYFIVDTNVERATTVSVRGNVTLILKEGCKLTINSGINVLSSGSLTIKGNGELVAGGSSGSSYVGINIMTDKGTVMIESGTVTATGGTGCAGIGGMNNVASSGGTINISGGTVTANGGDYGAGIGGGNGGSGGIINISGGTVTANGGYHGAGIGGGDGGSGGNINISGGTVTATGGLNGAGIGGTVHHPARQTHTTP